MTHPAAWHEGSGRSGLAADAQIWLALVASHEGV